MLTQYKLHPASVRKATLGKDASGWTYFI
ncbi:hypothetical protein L345_11030 [Ophiophagus hannah]|uniref:Uncharacterized protein n=1 Tax=Ophiophagus hannah TaxID=8665 RepID=V8NML0_OPHHA|nr:hypothetical protein L345_11030 [Ophiophagus hannah]